MIKNSNEFLSAVLENISDGIVACNKEGVLTVFNSASKKLHGLPLEPLPTSKWANHYNLYHVDGVTLMCPNDIPLFRALNGEIVKEVPVMIKRNDGIIKYTLCSGNPLKNKKCEIIGAVISMHDITESRIYKAALDKQNQELKKVNEELDRFVYSTSHELRSPLASVLGLVELAKAEEDNEDKLGLLNMIKRSINRLDDFIEDINDYVRNTRLELIINEIDFEEIIQESSTQLQHMDNAKNIKLIVEVNKACPFYGDKKRWTVIFNNFISNSIKYSNLNQKLSFININIQQHKDKVDLKISDNGLGIKNEYLTEIFKMFYRATSASIGSGLGLFIVNETIAKMGGSLKVESIYGEGTIFNVQIPNQLDSI